ncbi:hypothetical protein AXX12_12220 [Anaerosporomusa subterranea]|uniref:Uncharacterized protein n=1 Tax=Anaerosporomusa subterranea TaxID=1794912 RepID=A0A154BNB0_ANASB|nr:hypothetical protein AXX12_12220 [Anaerosporomusa subterranea]
MSEAHADAKQLHGLRYYRLWGRENVQENEKNRYPLVQEGTMRGTTFFIRLGRRVWHKKRELILVIFLKTTLL